MQIYSKHGGERSLREDLGLEKAFSQTTNAWVYQSSVTKNHRCHQFKESQASHALKGLLNEIEIGAAKRRNSFSKDLVEPASSNGRKYKKAGNRGYSWL